MNFTASTIAHSPYLGSRASSRPGFFSLNPCMKKIHDERSPWTSGHNLFFRMKRSRPASDERKNSLLSEGEATTFDLEVVAFLGTCRGKFSIGQNEVLCEW